MNQDLFVKVVNNPWTLIVLAGILVLVVYLGTRK